MPGQYGLYSEFPARLEIQSETVSQKSKNSNNKRLHDTEAFLSRRFKKAQEAMEQRRN